METQWGVTSLREGVFFYVLGSYGRAIPVDEYDGACGTAGGRHAQRAASQDKGVITMAYERRDNTRTNDRRKQRTDEATRHIAEVDAHGAVHQAVAHGIGLHAAAEKLVPFSRFVLRA